MEGGAPHDGSAHSGAYARGRSRGLRLPKCRDSGRPPFPQAHGVFSSLRGGSSRSRRSRSVQSLLLPRPDGFSLGRSRRHAASPLRIFLKVQGFKPFPQACGVSLRRNAPVLPEQAVPADVPRLPVTASVSSGLLRPFPQAGGVFQNRTAATRPCAFPQAAACSGNGREMVAEMRAEPIAYHARVPRNKNDPRRRAGGRENAPNFPSHPFSASGEIIPIGERPPSLSF